MAVVGGHLDLNQVGSIFIFSLDTEDLQKLDGQEATQTTGTPSLLSDSLAPVL
jgi:hypothetical protein